MRRRAVPLALAVIATACSEVSPVAPAIGAVEPSYGPLGGGTTVRIEGARFTPTTRVLVGGREAPLVRLVTSDTLDVVIPPGAQPGDAELVALDSGGYATARGLFRYSEPPVITGISPRDSWFTASDTVVTLSGSGFFAEAAGVNHVVVGGVAVTPMTVTSDSTIQFVAPPGQVFSTVDIEVVNDRGRAVTPHALRYTPGTRPGLLLFGRFSTTYAMFYDPVDQTTITLPRRDQSSYPLTAAVRDGDGTYWGVDYANRLGTLDLAAQTLNGATSVGLRVPSAVRVGDDVFAITRSYNTGAALAKLSLATSVATPFGSAAITCCGNFGIATDGTTVWLTMQSGSSYVLTTVDPQTGALGTEVTLTGPTYFRVEDLRYFDGALYAVNLYGGLARIDPVTGVVTPLSVPNQRFSAMEIYE